MEKIINKLLTHPWIIVGSILIVAGGFFLAWLRTRKENQQKAPDHM